MTYEIPAGTPQKKCKSCHAPIWWVRTANDKPMPVNQDGSPHFINCPQGKRWSGRGKSDDSRIPLFDEA